MREGARAERNFNSPRSRIPTLLPPPPRAHFTPVPFPHRLNYGEKLRAGAWAPGDALHASVARLVNTSRALGVSAIPYVYPILGFVGGREGTPAPPWCVQRGAARCGWRGAGLLPVCVCALVDAHEAGRAWVKWLLLWRARRGKSNNTAAPPCCRPPFYRWEAQPGGRHYSTLANRAFQVRDHVACVVHLC